MPLPSPNKGETKKDFTNRCMGNDAMNSEFPDQGQRFKVCQSLFNKSKKSEGVMETRAIEVDLDIREGDDEGIFEGHGAVFDKKNSHQEIIKRGAFKESIEKRGTKGIKMLMGHDRTAPIGKWTELREDSKGLFVRGKLLLTLAKAQEALLLMREGILDGLSIGFSIIEDSFDREERAFILHKIDLREVSPVLIPSASEALISKVREFGPDDVMTKNDLEKALRDAGFSRSFSQYICAGWSPPAPRDAEGDNQSVLDSISALRNSMSTA